MKKVDCLQTFGVRLEIIIKESLLVNALNGVCYKYRVKCRLTKNSFYIFMYPNGYAESDKGYVSIAVFAVKDVNVVQYFCIYGDETKASFSALLSTKGWLVNRLVTHNELRDHFNKLTKTSIVVNILYDMNNEFSLQKNVFDSVCDKPFDCELVIGDKILQVHQHFLALISTNLYTRYLINRFNTEGIVKIKIDDFDYEIVKNAFDFLYGRDMHDYSMENIINILRFNHKYGIKAKTLEKIPFINLNVTTFFPIINYAYDCNKKKLLKRCSLFLNGCFVHPYLQYVFPKLSTSIIIKLIKLTRSDKNIMRILYSCYNNGRTDALDRLESFMVLRKRNFFFVSRYMHLCDRPHLKERFYALHALARRCKNRQKLLNNIFVRLNDKA